MDQQQKPKTKIEPPADKKMQRTSRFPGFYNLDVWERLDKLADWYPLTTKEKWILKNETLTAEQADEAIIVTTGKFTRDAQDFAAGKPIQLIDGPQLLTLVQTVQTNKGGTGDPPKDFSPSPLRGDGRGEETHSNPPDCPSCGQPMILRTSKRGANAGRQFWGCSTYPACKGTRSAAMNK